MQPIVFTVPGVPKGKGRAKSSSRIGRDPKTGAARVFTRHYTPEATAAYESLVKLAAAKAMAGREVTDMLTAHILRGRPRLRDLCDQFDLPYSALQRPASAYRVLAEGACRAALRRLDTRMRDADIMVDLEGDVQPTALDNVNQDAQNSPRLVASTP